MSKFRTTIPIPVQELLDALPKNAFVHSQTYDKAKQVLVVDWETDLHTTGFTFPVDYPLGDLLAKRLPKAVKDKKKAKTPTKEENAPTVTPESKEVPPVNAPDYAWSKERFETEKATGVPLEYMGVESRWQALETDHVYREGFFYRKVGPLFINEFGIHQVTSDGLKKIS